MWHGNDTIWRTILDVNYAILFADKKGIVQDSEQRKLINIGDMIVCGDHEGPLMPSHKKIGGLLFSDQAVIFDLFVIKMMGFDYTSFPVAVHAFNEGILLDGEKSIEEYVLFSNDSSFNGKAFFDIEKTFSFVPTTGWKDVL